jgi:uncharacterized protein with HEPN domain
MINAAMLKVIQDCGEGVLVLVEGLAQDELLRSRLTRAEVQRQLGLMAGTLSSLSPTAQAALPEIDWAGWRATTGALGQTGEAQDQALWFAVQSLVPATLLWLRVYRQAQPELFAFTA